MNYEVEWTKKYLNFNAENIDDVLTFVLFIKNNGLDGYITVTDLCGL